MHTIQDTKILTVTPGKLSKYIDHDETNNILSESGQQSISLVEPETVTARFKMYLHHLKTSKVCTTYINQRLNKNIYITLRWHLFNREDSVRSPEKLEQSKAQFDFTMKYQLQVDQDFVCKVQDSPIIFKLYASSNGAEIFLSESQFFIDDLVEVVNVKQKQKIGFTSNVVDPSGEIIAFLDIWYKFTCKQKTLKAFLPDRNFESKKKVSVKIPDMLGDRFSKKSQNFSNVHVTDSEFDHFADSVWLVLNRNKILKTTQSDINRELQERVRWLHFEANWKQTLQENAILHGKNPEDVFWRQWREEDTANVKLRTYDNVTPKTYTPQLVITVIDLYFLEESPVLKNEDIKRVYIEYSFLGYSGPKMESPFSLPKAEGEARIVFKFKKSFSIDTKTNYQNCKKLTELIRRDEIVKFMVISEPVEDMEHPIQTCQEIGYSELPLAELIQLQDNEDSFEYEILNFHDPNMTLGYMTIRVEGILAVRKMALDLVAPKDYRLYV